MNKEIMNIEKLGYNEWFQEKRSPADLSGYQIARVMHVHKNGFEITQIFLPKYLLATHVFIGVFE